MISILIAFAVGWTLRLAWDIYSITTESNINLIADYFATLGKFRKDKLVVSVSREKDYNDLIAESNKLIKDSQELQGNFNELSRSYKLLKDEYDKLAEKIARKARKGPYR